MKAIVILPGENPTIKEVREDLADVFGTLHAVKKLPGLHMDLITSGNGWSVLPPPNGSLHIGEGKSRHITGPAVICRENAAGEYTDVRLCDLGLIQACWTPWRPRLEEKEHREDD